MEKGGCECRIAYRTQGTPRCWDDAALRVGLEQLAHYPHRLPQALCEQWEDSVFSQLMYHNTFGWQQTPSLVVSMSLLQGGYITTLYKVPNPPLAILTSSRKGRTVSSLISR